MKDYCRRNALAEFCIFKAHDNRLCDLGMFQYLSFNVECGHFVAARLEDFDGPCQY